MSAWWGFERQWRDELCRAALPGLDDAGLPGWEELDTDQLWDRFQDLAPVPVRRGWRLAVWVMTWRPLARRGRPHRFATLDPAEQEARLNALGGRSSYVSRQLDTVLRLVVCLAYLGHDDVRTRVTAWDSP